MDYYFGEHVANEGETFSPPPLPNPSSSLSQGFNPQMATNGGYVMVDPDSNMEYTLTSQDSLKHINHHNNTGGGGGSSSSNNGEATETEEKRKAQNRAAQRAFRERKEKRVKQLEDRLNIAQEETDRLSKENELLRRENILISQNYQKQQQQRAPLPSHNNQPHPKFATFPTGVGEEFCSQLTSGHGEYKSDEQKFQVYVSQSDGETLLGAGAIWEKIMEFDDESEIEMDDVIGFLKEKAVCDGFGPVYRMSDVEQALRHAKLVEH